MAKSKTIYICSHCGGNSPKWSGQCRECGSWNTLLEEVVTPSPAAGSREWNVSATTLSTRKSNLKSNVISLDEKVQRESFPRYSTQYKELDRVLGGGLVPGSYTLLGGDPGIGKSTLLLQMAGGLAKDGHKILYISGEESVHQSALRAQRLGISSPNIQVASESQLENILKLIADKKPDIVIVDSIQTIYLSELSSAPGSVSQVRECACRLMALAKGYNVSICLIGHVTKDGSIAGPKTLEHMVDTVLSFEGDSSHQFRLLRAQKNRFGATNELGVFEMTHLGLSEVENPSQLFLEERGDELIGSAVLAALEGTRPLLCEVQCLTTSTPLAMPRRTSLGFDVNRVHLIVAVLDKHLNLELNRSDIFVNIVGGLRLSEPAADLAVAAALISSAQHEKINGKTCFFGEIGLTGEIRASSFSEDRIKEAHKLGFEYFVLPESNKKHLDKIAQLTEKNESQFLWVKHVKDLAEIIAHPFN